MNLFFADCLYSLQKRQNQLNNKNIFFGKQINYPSRLIFKVVNKMNKEHCIFPILEQYI